MRHANVRNALHDRRRLLALLLAAPLLTPAAARAAEHGGGEKDKKKEKKDRPEGVPTGPPINTPLLVVEAVTAPVAPSGMVIMTLNIDCGTVENARAVDAMMPRVYNAVILELNREPLGKDNRVADADLEPLKRRLLFQINKALKDGPQIAGVYIRSLQEVPARTGSR